jgi:hypothetical protein
MTRSSSHRLFASQLETRIAELQATSNTAFVRAINCMNDMYMRYLINKVNNLNARIACLKDQLTRMGV